MTILTNLAGRVRHTHLPKSNGLLPVFEAVINAIHAIEERGLSKDEGEIRLEIVRSAQEDLYEDEKKPGRNPEREITGFVISDNGVGFDSENLKSFKTLETDHKVTKGCRGIGRLLWLKAFNDVFVNSCCIEEGQIIERFFRFSATNGVFDEEESVIENGDLGSKVHLNNFMPQYRENSAKTARAIAQQLFEHCLWYYVRPGSVYDISIVDDTEVINLNDIYEESMHSGAERENLTIKGYEFELLHVKLSHTVYHDHILAYCAAGRLVKEEKIKGKVKGLFGRLHDESGGSFVYSCYVSSPYLDENVRSERTGFDIDEDAAELFSTIEISLSDIREAALERAEQYLSEYLDAKKKMSRERVDRFVRDAAPKYRPILSRIPEDQLNVDPDISDKDLDLTLHKQLYEVESSLLSEGHEVMSPKENEDFQDYQERLASYLDKAEDVKRADLASYVSHRKVVLDLLEKWIASDNDGSYVKEDIIHNLIIPMKVESNEILFESSNLWIIDERLAFHDYLSSDKALTTAPVTGSNSPKRPDVFSFNVLDNPILVSEESRPPLASINIVEIKRPMRDDASQGEEKDPIEQAISYVDKIRKGGVETSEGRPIPQSSDIPGYCYIISDLTSSMIKRCNLHQLTPTQDNMGYFGYNPNFKVYIEVISFDRLVQAAKQRSRAFFDKLGLPSN